jgi:predicted O-methyltransferase YrrM
MTSYPNWFKSGGAEANFEKFLLPLAQKTLNCLQIGAYTGDATEWLFNNVFKNVNSTLTDVDTWEGSEEPAHAEMNWNSVEETYDLKTLLYQNEKRLYKRKITSDEFFSKNDSYFDFIYIDGDHKAVSVLKDGMNAFFCLKPNGILAFDDYAWSLGKEPFYDPKPAIDAILSCVPSHEFTLLEKGLQVWLQKK